MTIELEVKNDFPDRFKRQLIIKYGNAKIESNIFDSRHDDSKRLALELMWAAQQLLVHHELEQ